MSGQNVEKKPSAFNRQGEIDGIRGWAALAVVFCHLIHAPFGNLIPWLDMPGFILMNGIFAVHIFFVLSGDALSASFFRTGDPRAIDRVLLKRYFRLTMPVLLSCYVIFLLMHFGLAYNQQVAQLLNNKMLEIYLPQQPNFNDMLIYALAKVYTYYNFHTQESFLNAMPFSYNPVFWTMAVEMTGSILVFTTLYLLPRVQNPFAVLVFLCGAFFLLFNTYVGFFFGMLLGYMRQQGKLESWLASHRWQLFSGFFLLAFIPLSAWVLHDVAKGLNVAMAPLLLFVIYTNRRALSFFRNRLSAELGSLSFPLYATHFAILISLTCGLILVADQHQSLSGYVITGIIFVSILASFAAAYALRALERPYLRWLDIFANLMLTKQTPHRQQD